MDKSLDNHISKIAYYIDNQISMEKLEFQFKAEKMEKNRLNVIKRFDELEENWNASLADMQKKDNITIKTAIHEGRCEAIEIAKRILNDGLNAL